MLVTFIANISLLSEAVWRLGSLSVPYVLGADYTHTSYRSVKRRRDVIPSISKQNKERTYLKQPVLSSDIFGNIQRGCSRWILPGITPFVIVDIILFFFYLFIFCFTLRHFLAIENTPSVLSIHVITIPETRKNEDSGEK